MDYIWIVSICIGIGIICIVHFAYVFILSKRSKTWEITEGEIISSRVHDSNFEEGAIYKSIIKYRYTIGEKEYLSNRVFYGDYIGKNFPNRAQTIVNKYSKGKKVLVYYNPKYPNQSVLETGVHRVIYRELFAGILLLLIPVVLFKYMS